MQLTEIHLWIPRRAAVVRCSGAQEPVELPKVADAARLDHATPPPAASLDIRPTRCVGVGDRIVEATSLLVLVDAAGLGRVGP